MSRLLLIILSRLRTEYVLHHGPTSGGSYRSWKKRYFILSDASLKYYTKEGDNTPKKVIDLKQGRGIRNRKQCELEWPKDAKPGLSFGLATENRTFYLYGEDKDAVK